MLPLNLQFFAEEVPSGGEPPAQPNAGIEQPLPPKGGEPQGQSNETPVKTPEQIQQEFLKSLGVSSLDDAQKAIKGFQEFQDSQKTEAQKQSEQLQSTQQQLSSKDAEISNLNAKLSALTKGVRADAVEDVIKLVSGAEDIGKALDEVLTKYPQFGAVAPQQREVPKPSFGTPQYNEPKPVTEMDQWLSAFGVKKK